MQNLKLLTSVHKDGMLQTASIILLNCAYGGAIYGVGNVHIELSTVETCEYYF
jgi:hypothetical protein